MRINILLLSFCLFMLTFNSNALAENHAISKLKVPAVKTEPKKIVCLKPVKARGPGETIRSVAELKTIVIWSNRTTKKYEDNSFSDWHNAEAKNLKCKKQNNSNYYYCEIRATPCALKPEGFVPPEPKKKKK